MKKLILVIVALVTLTSCNQQKIGYVDITKLLEESDAAKDLKKEIERKGNEFQAKYQQIAADMDVQIKQGKMSQAQAQKNGEELQTAYQQEGTQLQQDSEERSNKLIEDIKEFIKEYAKKNSYTFVLGSNESGNVLYGEEKSDLTEKLIEAINKEYKTEGETTKEIKKK
jgi:outer membrane protein